MILEVKLGRIASCATGLEGLSRRLDLRYTLGRLAALIDGDTASLELGGDGTLARSLLDGLHRALLRLALRGAFASSSRPAMLHGAAIGRSLS